MPLFIQFTKSDRKKVATLLVDVKRKLGRIGTYEYSMSVEAWPSTEQGELLLLATDTI